MRSIVATRTKRGATDFVNVVVWGNWLETMASYASKAEPGSLWMERFGRAATGENGVMQCQTEVLPKFSVVREPCLLKRMREDGGTGDLADIILEEEDLPFRIKKKAGSFIDQLFDTARDFI